MLFISDFLVGSTNTFDTEKLDVYIDGYRLRIDHSKKLGQGAYAKVYV
jgi:hypothetical protein